MSFPRRAPSRTFPLPPAYRTFPLEAGDSPVVIPGRSQVLLLGERGYPFRELTVEPPELVTSIDWQKAGDVSWTAVSVGDFPDLISAARYVPFTPQEFHAGLVFSIRINGSSGVIEQLTVITDVRLPWVKVVKSGQTFRPFTDARFAVDASLVDTVEYEISGATTVAKTAIPRKQIASGTNNGVGDPERMLDLAGNDMVSLGVRVGDIIHNVTDGSQGVVTGFEDFLETNDVVVHTALAGGTADDWAGGDSYLIESGESLILIAQNFEAALSNTGKHLFTLYVTDTSANEFSATTPVEVAA